jgi:hypothetical protein
MKKKVEINLLKDRYNRQFIFIIIYNKYKFKQYILKNNIIYTFFIVVQFLYKYGFIKIKKNVCI